MSKNNNYDNLYVGFTVFDYEIETESYVHYETFGKVDHWLIVNPKAKIIYSVFDENGKEIFYDYKTNQRVSIEQHIASYESRSNPLKYGFSGGYIDMIVESIKDEYYCKRKNKKQTVGFLIPLDTYIKEKFNLELEAVSPVIIDKLLHLINIGAGRRFRLSMKPERAESQLKKIGYHKKTKQK